MATTQDKDDKGSPKKKKGAKDLDDLKKEVPLVRITLTQQHGSNLFLLLIFLFTFHFRQNTRCQLKKYAGNFRQTLFR